MSKARTFLVCPANCKEGSMTRVKRAGTRTVASNTRQERQPTQGRLVGIKTILFHSEEMGV